MRALERAQADDAPAVRPERVKYASAPVRFQAESSAPLADASSAPPLADAMSAPQTAANEHPPRSDAAARSEAQPTPQRSAPADDLEWQKVEAWLRTSAGVVLQYELKAAKAAFKQAGLATLVKVSRLTAPAVNKMQLSFDLRLRLLSAARELHKTLTFSGVNTSVLSTNDGEDSVEL